MFIIFNIQRFSTHDGDGIRTLIFFKGCPLRCAWCSNPEGQSFEYDLMFDRRKCISCLECVEISRNGEFVFVDGNTSLAPLKGIPTPDPSSTSAVRPELVEGSGQASQEGNNTPLAPLKGIPTPNPLRQAQDRLSQEGIVMIQREKIEQPLVFKDICPAKAITVVGEEKSVHEIIEEVKKDLLFYETSGGGVTISGGEPFAQPDFLHALLRELKKLEIHIAVETCLHVPWGHIKNNAEYIDVFLADLKHTDPKKFREYTGGNLSLILSNLKNLEARGANVIIRIPVIPEFNHTEAEMQRILDLVASFTNVHEVHFIPYHALGSNKYTLLGREYNLTTLSLVEDEIKQYMEYAKNKGLRSNVGG